MNEEIFAMLDDIRFANKENPLSVIQHGGYDVTCTPGIHGTLILFQTFFDTA